MAKTSTKAAVLEDTTEAETETEASVKQIINGAITRVLESTSVPGQHNRYKAMRAIAFQAFSNAIDDGTFDDLVDEAITNVDALPSGWELERVAKVEAKPAKAKASTKSASTATKAKVAKTSTKSAPAKAARRRPTR